MAEPFAGELRSVVAGRGALSYIAKTLEICRAQAVRKSFILLTRRLIGRSRSSGLRPLALLFLGVLLGAGSASGKDPINIGVAVDGPWAMN